MTVANHQALVRELATFATLEDLRRSDFFRRHRAALEAVLETPQWYSPNLPAAPNSDVIRMAGWNIERGNRFDAVLDCLRTHPRLSTADVIWLNEVDVGMARTGNRHVGFDLAAALGMHCVYGVEYLEMTKGIGAELDLPDDNTAALHGDAILSKFPLRDPRVVALPTCFEPFHFHEKRYGRRIVLLVEVAAPRPFTVATAHLEVRHTPACRARQMKALLAAVGGASPVVIGGDWNTNTFPRGTRWATLASAARVVFSDPDRLKHVLRHPDEGHEPLFDVVRDAGFDVWNLNDDEPTVEVPIAGMQEDAALVPAFLREWIARRLAVHGGALRMRLDWFAGRGFEVVGRPLTLGGLVVDGAPPSDHAPIVVDVRVQ